MIFATVGTQLPFPRLMDALDAIAGRHGLEIVAQTADPSYCARHLKTYAHLDPSQFDELFFAAERIVAHAGIGTLLAALNRQKPLIFFPRLASQKEHRNDHQLATVRELGVSNNFSVAMDELSLEKLLLAPALAPTTNASSAVSRRQLVTRIRGFIDSI